MVFKTVSLLLCEKITFVKKITIPPGPLKGGAWNLQQLVCAAEVPPDWTVTTISGGLGFTGRVLTI